MLTVDELKHKFINFLGDGASVSYSTVARFFIDEVNEGNCEYADAFEVIATMYVEYTVPLECFIGFCKYSNKLLPRGFVNCADKMRELIQDLNQKHHDLNKMATEAEDMFINHLLTPTELEVFFLLIGYSLSDDFITLSHEAKINFIKTYRLKKSQDKTGLINRTLYCIKGIGIKEDELFIPSYDYKTPFDFVIDYMQQHNIKNSVLTKANLDRRKKYKLIKDGIKEKVDCYRLIFILDLSLTHAKQFMTLCGFCFSPLLDTDVFFLEYLQGYHGKANSLEELTIISRKYCYEDFTYGVWS